MLTKLYEKQEIECLWNSNLKKNSFSLSLARRMLLTTTPGDTTLSVSLPTTFRVSSFGDTVQHRTEFVVNLLI